MSKTDISDQALTNIASQQAATAQEITAHAKTLLQTELKKFIGTPATLSSITQITKCLEDVLSNQWVYSQETYKTGYEFTMNQYPIFPTPITPIKYDWRKDKAAPWYGSGRFCSLKS